jgi:hypothetical protein
VSLALLRLVVLLLPRRPRGVAEGEAGRRRAEEGWRELDEGTSRAFLTFKRLVRNQIGRHIHAQKYIIIHILLNI